MIGGRLIGEMLEDLGEGAAAGAARTVKASRRAVNARGASRLGEILEPAVTRMPALRSAYTKSAAEHIAAAKPAFVKGPGAPGLIHFGPPKPRLASQMTGAEQISAMRSFAGLSGPSPVKAAAVAAPVQAAAPVRAAAAPKGVPVRPFAVKRIKNKRTPSTTFGKAVSSRVGKVSSEFNQAFRSNTGARKLRGNVTRARGGFSSGSKMAATKPGIIAGKIARNPVNVATESIIPRVARYGKEKGASVYAGVQKKGRSVHRIATKKGMAPVALGGLAAVSFAGGINQDGQVSRPLVQLGTGSPDYGRYVLGNAATDVQGQMEDRRKNRPYPLMPSKMRRPNVTGNMVIGMYNSRLA